MNAGSVQPIRGGSRLPIALMGLAILVIGTASYFLFFANGKNPPPEAVHSAPPPDPRTVYSGPFRNLHADVRETGSAICASCHAEIAAKYRQHPMGRSLTPIARTAHSMSYGKEVRNPFVSGGVTYAVENQGDRVWHVEKRLDDDSKPIYERRTEVTYAIGSGEKGYSYLARDNGGHIWQTWISWFSQKQIWDLSPGFKPGEWTFQARPVSDACLYCHANAMDPVPNTMNRYREPLFRGHSIGCERCHGPGELHVREREADRDFKGRDNTIVNPKHLEPSLREAVCQQCHLEGEARVPKSGRRAHDFRAGLKFSDYVEVFVSDHEGEDRKAVNHVEQMYLSKCFKGSDGKLGCISCHDPHDRGAPENRIETQRTNCLKCHKDCSVPKETRLRDQPDDSCYACHMPRFSASDIAHTASTNHQILRKKPVEGKGPAMSPFSGRGFRIFPERDVDPDSKEDLRNHAIAAEHIMKGGHLFPASALAVTRKGIDANPDDAECWMAHASVLESQGNLPQALIAFERVLALQPDHEWANFAAGMISMQMQKNDKALAYLKKFVELNPEMWLARANLAILHLQSNDIDAARPHIDKWLAINPGDAEAHFLLATILVRKGDIEKGDAEYRIVVALKPQRMAEFARRWQSLKGKP